MAEKNETFAERATRARRDVEADTVARTCREGGTCRTWFTCGRGQDFPAVDHVSEACDLEYLDCVSKHYRHECAHDFQSGPGVESEDGRSWSASCACGLTAMAHDWRHSP